MTIDGFKVATARDGRAGEGRIRLAAGAHPLVIQYEQIGGPYQLAVSWAREGQTPLPLPRWALWTSPHDSIRATVARVVDPILLVTIVALGLCAIWITRHRLRFLMLQVPRLDWALVLILLFGAYSACSMCICRWRMPTGGGSCSMRTSREISPSSR